MLALKGAALHELHVYAPGERPMADVDLLVSESSLAASVAMLLIGRRLIARKLEES